MIVEAEEREQTLESIVRTDVPGMVFLITRAAELLRHTSPDDVTQGRRFLLSAAHRADEVCMKLTALVELEARGRQPLG